MIIFMDGRDVDFETAKFLESFFTQRTFVITFPLMDGRDVMFETANCLEIQVALITFWAFTLMDERDVMFKN